MFCEARIRDIGRTHNHPSIGICEKRKCGANCTRRRTRHKCSSLLRFQLSQSSYRFVLPLTLRRDMAIDPSLASIVFGLSAAATWGLGDFGGGLATRRSNALSVVLLSQTVGFFTLLVLALLVHEPLPQLS